MADATAELAARLDPVVQPLTIRRASIEGQMPSRDLYTAARFLPAPASDALEVRLDGCTIWPALVNAHDHLELNHYPRSKFRPAYDNAHQWGEDMNRRLRNSPYREGQAVPLADRVFIGGLKNLLCGALTVAHHNRLHRPLEQPDYPVRVLRRYGWAHSLHFERDPVATYRKVEQDVPWIIHLAEGVDSVAALEYGRLKKMGLVRPNTVIVHGVGLTADDMLDGARTLRGLVWCPSSNRYLLGYTADVERWLAYGGRVALGSDSRLTADGDLLDELRAAQETGQVDAAALWRMVTTGAAAMFDLEHNGRLEAGMWADWIALRGDQWDAPPVGLRRADLALVVRGGVPQIGDPDLMARFPVPVVPAVLDGQPKAIHAALAARILQCRVQEPGLTVEGRVPRRRMGVFSRLLKGRGMS